jgi:hypothetical protein
MHKASGTRLTPFIMAHLLQPEARSRRVQHPQNLQVLRLTKILRQLDNWSRTIEYFPTSIQYEMIVSRHERECDRETCPIPLREKHAVIEPAEPSLLRRFAEIDSLTESSPITPEKFFL